VFSTLRVQVVRGHLALAAWRQAEMCRTWWRVVVIMVVRDGGWWLAVSGGLGMSGGGWWLVVSRGLVVSGGGCNGQWSWCSTRLFLLRRSDSGGLPSPYKRRRDASHRSRSHATRLPLVVFVSYHAVKLNVGSNNTQRAHGWHAESKKSGRPKKLPKI
jgi:hypothetical protein